MTKAKITIGSHSIEFEGSEEFVSRNLEDFRRLIESSKKIPENKDSAASEIGDSPATPKNLQKKAKSNAVDGAEKVALVKSKSKAAKVVATRFDIHGGPDQQSLEVFFKSKNPGKSNGLVIAVIGYYITEVLGEENFSEGQVEYAYKMLSLKRPAHLHQIMINTKNDKDYYEQIDGQEGVWALTRSGEIYVSDKLPGDAE